MITPWSIARSAAAALAGSSLVQSQCVRLYGAPLAVYAGSLGTGLEDRPLPWVCVRLSDATDGPGAGDEVGLAVELRVDAGIDPATGERVDPSKPVAAPDGVLETGRGGDLVLLAGICSEVAAAASPVAVLGERRILYRIGEPAGDSAVAALRLRIAQGAFDDESNPPAIRTFPPTEQPQP